MDYLVISRVGAYFTIWNYFIIILCIWSAYVYMYIAAFAVPETGSDLEYMDLFFNGIFLIDMMIRFFVDYYDNVREITIKTQPKLALNYFKTDLLYDAIATIPFLWIYHPSEEAKTGQHQILIKLIYLVKIIRISKLNQLLKNQEFKARVHQYFTYKRIKIAEKLKNTYSDIEE